MNSQLSAVEIGKCWTRAVENYEAMKSTFTELAAHPQATDEQLLHAARQLGAVRNSLRDIKRLVNTRPQPKAVNIIERMAIDRITRTKL